MNQTPFRQIDLGDHPCALRWSPDGTWLAGGSLSGDIGLCRFDNEKTPKWTAHPGGVLDVGWTSGGELVSVGQDGRLCWWSIEGEQRLAIPVGKGWAERVLPCEDNRVVTAAGKNLSVWNSNGSSAGEAIEMPSTISDMCLSPEGGRVAVAHYGGVTLVDLAKVKKESAYEWKGSLLHLAWSPTSPWLMASSQEQGVMGFSVDGNANCAIDNFPGKVHSMAWTQDGDWLGMAGGYELLFWPFDGPGPMNREAILGSIGGGDVSDWRALSAHPSKKIFVAGNEDGEVIQFSQTSPDANELSLSLVHQMSHSVVAIAWHPSQNRLAVADSYGEVHLLEGDLT